MSEKIGANHARDMFHKGLAELRAMSSWDGSNVAQPDGHGLYGPPAEQEQPSLRQAVEESRASAEPVRAAEPERDGPERGIERSR